MEILSTIFSLLAFIGVAVGLVLWKSYLPKYFQKKAENLATKEDIAEITDQVEKVKNKYTTELEKIRGRLEAKTHISKIQYEREYGIYQELWAALVHLREKTLLLRPILDYYDPQKSEEDRKRERLSEFYDAYRNAVSKIEVHRPFYAENIYLALKDVQTKCHHESVDYEHSERDNWAEYWRSANNSRDSIIASIDEISASIRNRFESIEVT